MSPIFTCIDCNTTFQGNSHQSHTSCISEAEKFQKSTFQAKKTKDKSQRAAPTQAQESATTTHDDIALNVANGPLDIPATTNTEPTRAKKQKGNKKIQAIDATNAGDIVLPDDAKGQGKQPDMSTASQKAAEASQINDVVATQEKEEKVNKKKRKQRDADADADANAAAEPTNTEQTVDGNQAAEKPTKKSKKDKKLKNSTDSGKVAGAKPSIEDTLKKVLEAQSKESVSKWLLSDFLMHIKQEVSQRSRQDPEDLANLLHVQAGDGKLQLTW